ncbi:EamA family transporter [Pseudonocardia sp.]|uniref:EamA family transporter n=1 Tax=Pseudonocardia sp. TaxID=60912 RepID=UPI003D111635
MSSLRRVGSPGRSRTTTGLALGVVSAASFGVAGPVAKALIDAGWSAGGAVLVRIGGAAVVLLVVLAVARPGVLAALRADGPALLLYGALAVAGVQVGYFSAMQYVPVAVALLLEYLGPVLVIVWVWLVRRRPPSRMTVVGAALAVAGLLMVLQVWSAGALDWRGVAWGLFGAVCWASYFLVVDRAGARTPPLVLVGVGMVIGTLVVALCGLVGLLPVVVAVPPDAPVVLAGADVGWVLPAAVLALVCALLAYGAGVGAVSRIGATRGSLVALLEVVASALMTWLLLGELPGPWQLAGGALILAGVVLTRARPAAELPAVADGHGGSRENRR